MTDHGHDLIFGTLLEPTPNGRLTSCSWPN
jgi:hypothetical protein